MILSRVLKKKIVRYALLSSLVCLWLVLTGAQVLAADWRQQPCVTALAQRQILAVETVRYPAQPISQRHFAAAVLNAFPGKFAAANAALGLTFDGETEVEDSHILVSLESHI